MATLTIRKLEETVKTRLRMRAALHGHSMEMEARAILREALMAKAAPPRNLADAIRGHVASLGGVDLIVPPREPVREPPDFSR